MASNQDLSRGLTKTPTAFAERFKARIAGKIREQQVTPPAPIDELLRLSQERRSRAIAHLAGPATHLTAQSPQFHTATPALPPLPATAPLTGPVELSGQKSVEGYPGADDATEQLRNASLGTAHVDQPGAHVDQPGAHVIQQDEASAIITDQGDSQQLQNARAEYPRTRDIPCGPGHFEHCIASTEYDDSGSSDVFTLEMLEKNSITTWMILHSRRCSWHDSRVAIGSVLIDKIALENDRVFQAMSNEYQPRFHSWLDESHSRNAQGRSFTETLSPRCVIVCADNEGATTVADYVQFICNKTSVYPRLFSDKKNAANSTGRCDVLIATSGSLSTIARKGGVNFDRLETLVLDEFHKIMKVAIQSVPPTGTNGCAKTRGSFDRLKTLVLDEFHKTMVSKEQKDQLDGAFFSPERYHLDVMGAQVQRIISEGGNSISSTDRDKWLRKDASAAPLEFKHMRLQNPMLDLRKYSFILVSEHDLFDFTANQIATHVPGKILVFLHPEPKPMPFATLFERKSPTDALKSATVIILRPNALKRTLGSIIV
ncbi:hypothetical protein LTR96_003602 [Exophiala xenobiotica]|nr:hypothetical protein LTR96_003602 [Exophiala xenobiotica]